MILITFTIIVRIFLWNCPGNVILLSICQYYKNKKCKSRRSIFLFLLSQTFLKISRNVVIKQEERFLSLFIKKWKFSSQNRCNWRSLWKSSWWKQCEVFELCEFYSVLLSNSDTVWNSNKDSCPSFTDMTHGKRNTNKILARFYY